METSGKWSNMAGSASPGFLAARSRIFALRLLCCQLQKKGCPRNENKQLTNDLNDDMLSFNRTVHAHCLLNLTLIKDLRKSQQAASTSRNGNFTLLRSLGTTRKAI
jgi:hypothetical protein